MKKTCLTIVFILITYGLSLSQQDIDEKHHKRIAQLGLSKQINWKHNYVNDKPAKNGTKTSETSFDNKGNVIQIISFLDNGEIKSKEIYNYNLRGERIEYTKYQGNSIKYQKKTEYNNDKIVRETGYNGSEEFTNVYSYNTDGKVSKIEYQSGSGTTLEIREFTYDANTTYVNVMMPNGTVNQRIAITKDDQGNILEEKSYTANNAVIDKKTYKYNQEELPVEESKFGGENTLRYKYIYNYNNNGDITEFIEQNPHDGKFTKKKYTYDANGNLTVLEWRRKPDNEFNSMTYTYDSKGLRTSVETNMPSIKFKLLNKFTYE
ncbi:MAG: hypothetical protein GVY19_00935 [Bacteroidetes bacterium]|jgi:hypothetical protein|nr:hypothetical protein [Bacteroidota bacterium]